MSNCEHSSNGRPEPWRRKIFRAQRIAFRRAVAITTALLAWALSSSLAQPPQPGSIIGRIKLTTAASAAREDGPNEATAGFRVNRDVLLKASYYTRRPYGRIGDWDHQAAVQAVWDHRWW